MAPGAADMIGRNRGIWHGTPCYGYFPCTFRERIRSGYDEFVKSAAAGFLRRFRSGRYRIERIVQQCIVPQSCDVVQDDAGAVRLDAQRPQGGGRARQVFLPASKPSRQQPLVERQPQRDGIAGLVGR